MFTNYLILKRDAEGAEPPEDTEQEFSDDTLSRWPKKFDDYVGFCAYDIGLDRPYVIKSTYEGITYKRTGEDTFTWENTNVMIDDGAENTEKGASAVILSEGRFDGERLQFTTVDTKFLRKDFHNISLTNIQWILSDDLSTIVGVSTAELFAWPAASLSSTGPVF